VDHFLTFYLKKLKLFLYLIAINVVIYQDSFHQQMHPFIKHIKC